MKKVILFFGSFDPLHKGHISIMEKAIKRVNADYLYIGLNKNSNKGRLTSFFHRKNMIKEFIKANDKYKFIPFSFDYKNIEKTYKNIFSLIDINDNNYILIGQDQFSSLHKWHKFDMLLEKFTFIIAKRGNIKEDIDSDEYIFIDHNNKEISSSLVKNGDYKYTCEVITNYILNHNLYLKDQIRPYLTLEKYQHTLSVAKTALLINKKAKLGIDEYKVEKAALLHDIAKNLDINTRKKLINENYSQYKNESNNILHQYLGELIARENFFVYDEEILDAIKYHTTGRANMSKLEKLIYMADKIEPLRGDYTKPLLDLSIRNFEKGFIEVVKNNKVYLEEKKIDITNIDTKECFEYYIK